LTIVEPAGGRRGIVVDQIRYLQDVGMVAPVEGQFRVILIFGADSITQEAGNCMLKLLEEPPSYLVMILVADRLTRVLPTIKSRCSVVPMAPLERETLVRRLVEEEKLDRDLAKVAAALSECRPGVALSVLQTELLKRRRDVFEARLQLDRFGEVALPSAVARIGTRGGLDDALWLLLSYTRDRMVRSLAPNQPGLLVHEDVIDLLDAVNPDVVQLDEEADRLIKAFEQLSHPFIPNQRAALQTALWPE
jgi:DNA polymerase-3 subunit delta'